MADTALDIRRTRGLELAATKRITKRGGLYVVPSATHAGSYIVEPNGEEATCSCPDFTARHAACKHTYAVLFARQREEMPDGSVKTVETLRITYTQEWTSYNLAQTTEKLRVAELLRQLCDLVPQPEQGNGRPSLPLSDQIFCAAMKVYGTMSGRRSTVDLNEWQAKGLLDKAPHYNSIFRYLDNPELTPILRSLIEQSAAPMAAIESDFAADSSGFATSIYNRWYDEKYGKERSECQWIKAHVMCGVKTHIVTSAIVTPKNGNDAPYLPPLLAATTPRFDVREVSADRGYLSHANQQAIVDAGADPYIPFKSNSVAVTRSNKYRNTDRTLWRKLFHLFSAHRPAFNAHYHKRSNVETVFHMVKSKFGGRVRAKTFTAQTNEVLCKILCHNLCVLVQATYELGLAPVFEAEKAVASELARSEGL